MADATTTTTASFRLADAHQKLSEPGSYESRIRGWPQAGTSAAISHFQKTHGLPVSGQHYDAIIVAQKQ